MIPLVFFAMACYCVIKAAFRMNQERWLMAGLYLLVGVVAVIAVIQTLPAAFGPP